MMLARIVCFGVGLALDVSAAVASSDLVLCRGTHPVKSPTPATRFFDPDGSGNDLMISASGISSPNCSRINLPVVAADIAWTTLLSDDEVRDLGEDITLQGGAKGGDFSVSEFEIANPPAVALSLRLNENVLPALRWRVFGIEERAVLNPRRGLHCAPGSSPAGVSIDVAPGWPSGAPLQLELAMRGRGRFGVALADRRRERSEEPLALGFADVGADTGSKLFDVPANPDRWTTLAIVCPASSAEIELLSVKVQVAPNSRRTSRSAWVWSPAVWQDRPETIFALQARHGFQEIYVTIPVTAGGPRDPERLADFVRQSRQRGLAVWAVSGDPHDVLPDRRHDLVSRLAAIAGYNQLAPADARLAGMQLDIEPYLLPGYQLAPNAWRERYLDTIRAARKTLAAVLPLDLVVPGWWGAHPHWGRQLLDALAPLDISLTVMNYRTDPKDLLEASIPFLEWSSRHGRRVRMALEAGPLPDEERRRYRHDRSGGELWVLALGRRRILVLLSKAAADLPGRAYRYSHTLPAPAARLSFLGDISRLTATADSLLPLWAAWPGFAGIAIHGIDGEL